MAALFAALRELGAEVATVETAGQLPVEICGPAGGGAVEIPGDVSSQFLSALLIAGPLFRNGVRAALLTPLVSRPYVAMSAAVMGAFGVDAAVETDEFAVGRGVYQSPGLYFVEPDASSASYFFAAAAMTGGRVRVEGLGSGSLQGDLAFVEVLRTMGATVEMTDGFVEVSGRASQGVEVDLTDFSDMLPTLAVVAAVAETPSVIGGVGFVRGKETDRIRAVATELARLGVGVEEHATGLTITPRPIGAATIETYGDHRMAMAFAALGLVVNGIAIADPGCVAKTFPDYFAVLDRLRH
jgi:3-phosphoshikimate 1-carboxyvinyltransferase